MQVEEQLIEMPDGVRLAADLFFPDRFPQPNGGRGAQLPALLEYLPYRKDDGRLRTWDLFSYVVERGYVGARVDIRGTGRSGGVLPDREYSEQEQRDAEVIIDWLARQTWCNGNIGMWGISWGGFNSIHMAMRESTPDALKAIVACMATDDLFHDDVHYIDGMMHIDQYAVMIDLLNAMPPAPEYELDEDAFASRFDQPPWLLNWLRHQRRDEFWERASLRPHYQRLRVPSYLVGGYLDGYRDSVPRMLEAASVPVRALMGPWNHSWPHDAVPGPEIEWRSDVVEWLDHFLKGVENGIESEPSFTVFLRESHPPDLGLATVPGRWLAEDGWPVARLEPTVLYPTADRALRSDPGPHGIHELAYVPSAGANASMWWGELTPDQRPADAFSLVFDSEPLSTAVQVVGFPLVEVSAAVDAPQAHFFGRLCDVAPDGATALVTGGGLNGAHRDSADRPDRLEAGHRYDLSFQLHFTSWVFPAGHRMRLSISNAMFPMIWPTPYPMTLSLATGEGTSTRLTLPVLPGPDRDGDSGSRPGSREVQLEEAGEVVPLEGFASTGSMLPNTWTAIRDEERGSTTIRWEGHDSDVFPWGSQEGMERLEYQVCDADPAHARVAGGAQTDVVNGKGRKLSFRHALAIESDEEAFVYDYTRQVFQDGSLVRERHWKERIPRDHQ